MTTLKDQLENIIDRNSVFHVLEAISQICYEKGQHIHENWQDKSTAKNWEKIGGKISSLAVNHVNI